MAFAAGTAEAAGAITRSHFGSSDYELKGDGSEVTVADRAAEEFIRGTIADRFPNHGVFGEEGARIEGGSAYRWIIDPIDGTRSFASGVPLYGILLALEHEGTPVLGCASFPELGETLVGATGAGCWRNGMRARVSDCETMADARVVTSGLEYWRDWATPAGKVGFEKLVENSRFARTWGDCFGYVLVATGRAEILADPACGAYWDYAPMLPIIEEAGGRYTSLIGKPIAAWSSALATNGLLHAAGIERWAPATSDLDLQTQTVISRREGRSEP